MKSLILFPFNGNAMEAFDFLLDQYKIIGFVDDDLAKQKQSYQGVSVFSRELFQEEKTAKVLCVPGSSESYLQRKELITSLNISEDRFIQAIHPSANISKFATIGHNCLIMAGVSITSNAHIGNHVCILPNSVIHHDSSVADFCLLASNVVIAGHSHIKSECYLGASATIGNNISIGEKSLIGMSAAVTKSFPAQSVAIGVPAQSVEK